MQLLKKIEEIPYTLLFILVASISIATLKSDFIFIDDTILIVNNPQISFSASNLMSIFSKPLGQIFDAADYPIKFIYYRPALSLYYMLNTIIWGINPVGFHISNLLLHLIITFFIYRTGLLLFAENKRLSLLAAALFSVHPVHNELIGRVAMNENLLGLFMLLSLYFYLQGRKYSSLVAFVLALLTKESAVMLPCVLFFFELSRQRVKGAAVYLAPYVVAMTVYLIVRASVVGIPDSVSFNVNVLEKLLLYCSALAAYLRLLFVPYPLSIYYPTWNFTLPLQWDGLLSVVICILLGYAIWRCRDDELISPLLLGTFILLAPVVFKANNLILDLDMAFIAERQLYVPAILYTLLIAAVISRYRDSYVGKSVIAVVALSIPVFMYTTIVTCAVWESSETVRARFVRNYPDSTLAHKIRGGVLFQQGDLDGALIEFRAALPKEKTDESAKNEIVPGSFPGNKYKNLKSFLNQYSLASYQPEYADLHFNIGQIYLAKSDIETAMKKFRTTLVLKPHFIEARTAIASIYMKKKMFREASREFKLALKDIDALRLNR